MLILRFKGDFLKEIPLKNPKELFLPKTAVFGGIEYMGISRHLDKSPRLWYHKRTQGRYEPFHFAPLIDYDNVLAF